MSQVVIRRAMMSEKIFVNSIMSLAKTLGFRRVHFLTARTNKRTDDPNDKGWRTLLQGDVGYPDITLAGHGRLIVIEAKGMRGVLSAAQIAWLCEMHRVPGVECHVWYPNAWHDGTVARVLQGKVPKEISPWWLQLHPSK